MNAKNIMFDERRAESEKEISCLFIIRYSKIFNTVSLACFKRSLSAEFMYLLSA